MPKVELYQMKNIFGDFTAAPFKSKRRGRGFTGFWPLAQQKRAQLLSKISFLNSLSSFSRPPSNDVKDGPPFIYPQLPKW